MCDLMILNVLALLCSLPVITAGPVLSALYASEIKLVRDEESFPVKDFFRALKNGFRQSLLLWLVMLGLIAVMAADISFALGCEGNIRKLYLVLSGVLGVLLLIMLSLSLSLSARFENSFKGQLINSFKLAIISPGRLVLTWIVYAVPVAVALLLPLEIVAYIGWFYILFGLSLPVYINSAIINKIFLKIEGQDKNDP